MSALWRWITARHLLHEGGRTLLTIMGVALGVAVFIAIRLANHSALAAFAATVDSVSGRANLQVVGSGTGFPEGTYDNVRTAPGVEQAAPVVQFYARAVFGKGATPRFRDKGVGDAIGETVLVMGLDPIAEADFKRFGERDRASEPAEGLDLRQIWTRVQLDPRVTAVSKAFADRHGLKVGDSLRLLTSGREVTVVIRAVVKAEGFQQALGGNVVLCPLFLTQAAFGKEGKLDRIDLVVPENRREAVLASLRSLLPPGVRLTRPAARTQQVENMVRAFGLNLLALSFIALFVSLFLIFNSVSFSVLRRRREIGILRGLGVTRRGVLWLFLGEGLLMGVIGSLIGLGLGTLMARGALGAVTQTMSVLYLIVQANQVVIDPATYATGFAIGVGTALVSALAPAYEASLTPPGVTMRQGMQIEAAGVPYRKLSGAGFGLLVCGGLTAYWTVLGQQPIGGFLSAFFVLGGFSLLAPAWTGACERLLDPLLRAVGGVEAVLGGRYLRESLARASVVVAALMVSVGMMVAMSTMVGSFRKTVDVWVGQTIRGDLYIEPVGRDVAGSAAVLPPQVIEIARKLPGVAAVDTYRAVEAEYGGRISHAIAIDFGVQASHGNLKFLRGQAKEILPRAVATEGLIISESFAFHNHLREGQTVTLETPSGPHTFPICGVFYDYSTDAGAVYLDYHLYERLWLETRTESLALYVLPGFTPDQVRSELVKRVPDDILLYITPNQSLRSRVMRVFDQTFRITYALQAIAVMVAVLGVISTLTALILQRGREIGVLRAVGALRGQVRKTVLIESGLLGLIGSLLGCVCGVILSLLLIHVINKQFFGWSIRLYVDPWLFVQASGLMVAAAVLAGLGPARMAATRVAAEAMRVE